MADLCRGDGARRLEFEQPGCSSLASPVRCSLAGSGLVGWRTCQGHAIRHDGAQGVAAGALIAPLAPHLIVRVHRPAAVVPQTLQIGCDGRSAAVVAVDPGADVGRVIACCGRAGDFPGGPGCPAIRSGPVIAVDARVDDGGAERVVVGDMVMRVTACTIVEPAFPSTQVGRGLRGKRGNASTEFAVGEPDVEWCT